MLYEKRNGILQSLYEDTEWLMGNGIMDYSLIVTKVDMKL
jgi:hypothetical protein